MLKIGAATLVWMVCARHYLQWRGGQPPILAVQPSFLTPHSCGQTMRDIQKVGICAAPETRLSGPYTLPY